VQPKEKNKEKDDKDDSDLEEPEKDGLDPEELAQRDESWRLTAESVPPTQAQWAQHSAELRASTVWHPTRGMKPGQLKANHSPGKATLPAATGSPAR
jgi:hypothetical protein